MYIIAADLIYPSVLYFEGMLNNEYNDLQDIPWKQKSKDVYWAGRTSGGLASAHDDWKTYHRQRFVATVNGIVDSPLSKQFVQDAEPYKVRFPDVNQCDEVVCEQMIEYFKVDRIPDHFEEIYKHAYLFDMDGNVFSRRFYSLMYSHGTVLKQTLQQEYFDEWLFPWVHYIPVSMVSLAFFKMKPVFFRSQTQDLCPPSTTIIFAPVICQLNWCL